MLIVRKDYAYYLLYSIKMFRETANDVIATIKQQNLLFLIKESQEFIKDKVFEESNSI